MPNWIQEEISDMKKLLINFSAITILVTLIAAPAKASSIPEEQWRIPYPTNLNWHGDAFKSISIESSMQIFDTFPHLWAESYPNSTWSRYTCTDTKSIGCTNPDQYSYQSILPVCKDSADTDCIDSLNATGEDGSITGAKFTNYNLDKHPQDFTTPPELGIPHTANPSVWNISGAPHANGTSYLVVVGLTGTVDNRNKNSYRNSQSIYANVIPVSVHKKALATLPSCWQREGIDLNNLVGNSDFCTGSEGQYVSDNEPRCSAAYGTSGDCYAPEPFPSGFKFELNLRLKKEPLGWIHGRIETPNISITKSSSGSTLLKVSASPVKVPVFFTNGYWNQLSEKIKQWWLTDFRTYILNGDAAGTASGSDPEHPDRNVPTSIVFMTAHPYGDFSMSIIKNLSGEVKDTAAASPTTWSFRSLDDPFGNSVNPCISTGTGLKGIVTTNSTSYAQGAPTFSNGNLNYKVASLHYLSDGSIFHGTYDLILRSDVARCLYGFSNAPISATISVLSENGANQVAVTSVNEKSGWLYLSASGFTFSNPSISVKLTQEGPKPKVVNAGVPKKLTCVKGNLTKVVSTANCPTEYKKK